VGGAGVAVPAAAPSLDAAARWETSRSSVAPVMVTLPVFADAATVSAAPCFVSNLEGS
jgi:hypothetical protein